MGLPGPGRPVGPPRPRLTAVSRAWLLRVEGSKRSGPKPNYGLTFHRCLLLYCSSPLALSHQSFTICPNREQPVAEISAAIEGIDRSMAAYSLKNRSFSIARLLVSRSAQISHQTRSLSADALVEIKPGDIGIVSGVPEEHLKRRVNQFLSINFL